MESTGNINRGKKASGFLKTTTWGTLIAASVLAAAWSFGGHFGEVNDSLLFKTSGAVAKLNPFHPVSTSKTSERSSEPAVESSQGKPASTVALAGQPAGTSNGHSAVAQAAPFFGVSL